MVNKRISLPLTMLTLVLTMIFICGFSSTSKVAVKKIKAAPSSLSSPMKITIGTEISGTITDDQLENCYSFTIASKSKGKIQLNIFQRNRDSITPGYYLVKTSNMKNVVKCGVMSTDFLQYIIPSDRYQSRYNTSTNSAEYAKIYSLSPGSYTLCIHAYSAFVYPVKYSFVTFLGDLSKNPWTGKYKLTADSQTGLGYRKSSKSSSSSNISKEIRDDWEKERDDAETRQRAIDFDRHNHNLPHN